MEIILSGISACVAFVALILSYFSFRSTEKAQQQNVDVQLFKKRYEVYLLLKSWHNKLNNLFDEKGKKNNDKEEMFRYNLLNYLEDEKLLSYSSQIRRYDNLVGSLNKTNNVGLDTTRINTIRAIQKGILQDKWGYITIAAGKMQHEINAATYLFSLDEIDVDKIKRFTSVYFDITQKIATLEKDRNTDPGRKEKVNNDIEALRELNNGADGVSKILETMEEQLDGLRVSFNEE